MVLQHWLTCTEALNPLEPSTRIVDLGSKHLRISVLDQWYRGDSSTSHLPVEAPTPRGSTIKQRLPTSNSMQASRNSTLSGLFDGWASSGSEGPESVTSSSPRRWSVSDPVPDSLSRLSNIQSTFDMSTQSSREITDDLTSGDNRDFEVMIVSISPIRKRKSD